MEAQIAGSEDLGLKSRGIVVRLSKGTKGSYLLKNVQADPRAHATCY